jgi:hypothetical protein
LKLIGKAPRGALFITLTLALGCVIAACGSASSSSSTTSSSASSGSSGTTTTTAATGSARRTALAACLKRHGVTLPSRPAGAPSGGAPGGAPGSGTGTGTTGSGTTPRRGFFGGGGGFANNPKLQAAFKACGANFGFRGGGNFAGRLSHTAVTKYVTCVRQHGYNLPNPNFSGKGPIFPANIRTNQKFIAASKPCQSLLIPPRPSGSGGTSTTSGA